MNEVERRFDGIQRSRLRWRYAFFAAAVTLVLGGLSAYAAISSQSSSYDGFAGNTIVYDETKFTITVDGHFTSLGETAAGTSFGSPAGFSSGATDVARESTTIGEWYYKVTVAEAGIDSVTAQTTTAYEAELFLDGATQGKLYFKQTVAEALVAEDVELKWNLGSSLSGSTSYVLRIKEVSS